MSVKNGSLSGLFSQLIGASESFMKKLPKLCVTMQLTCKKRRKEIIQDDSYDANNHLLKLEKFDLKDVTSPLEAAVVAKVKDSLSDADPVEIVNIEMDLGLLLKQCFKLAEPEVFPTGDLGSSEDLLKVDESFVELMLRLENLFEVCTSIVNSIQTLKSSGTVIDSVSRADVPEATSTDEQCLISPICNDHCLLFTPIITEICEEGFLQYYCGFAERSSIFYATNVFRSQGLASVRTIYITFPRSPQIAFPTKLKSTAEFNRLSVTAPSETEQFHRWKEGAKKPWILPNKVSKLLQSNRSIGNFGLRNRLTNVLSKLVTPRRRANSELTEDCEKVNFDINFPLDALAESEYIQFVEADLDSSIYWYANAGTSMGCLEQKSKTSGSSSRGGKMKLSLKRHKVKKFNRRWKNGAPFSVTDTDSLLLNNKETGCKVDASSSIPKINTGIRRGKSLLTLFKVKQGSDSRVHEKTLKLPSPLVKLSDVSSFNQDINEENGCAQVIKVDAQAQSGSHTKFDQKMVTSTNPTPGARYSFSRGDVKRVCKSCSTSGYRGRLETSNNFHLLKADVRMPSLLQNTANKAKRQIRMPEKMKHGRCMYGTPDETSVE